MLKKLLSILMLYSALAIMLGHNFIEHHHHYDFGQHEISHHHGYEHHSHDNDADNDTEDESNDWKHFFSSLQHGEQGLTFLINHDFGNNFSKQPLPFTSISISNFVFKQVIIDVRQNAPPFIVDYYNSINCLSFGLRAPPVFIV